jgi:RNA polymerase sigma-70 factor (ECF subfamily)
MSTQDPDPESETQAIARAARAGQPGRLGELYGRVLPSLYAWARLRIRPEFRRVLSAEDLVQEVWLRASEAFRSFDPAACSFRAWVFGVAKNVLFEVQRRAFRQIRERTPEGSTSQLMALQEIPADVTSLTQRVQKDEGIRSFLERVAELDEEDRRTLIHCGLEELPLREAAERMDLTRDAVAKRWQRLRDRMRGWRVPEGIVAS